MRHISANKIVALSKVSVFPATEFCVRDGVNYGDPIGDPSQTCLGDGYRLDRSARLMDFDLETVAGSVPPHLVVSAPSPQEAAGTPVKIAARLTLMTQAGVSIEAVLFAFGDMEERLYLCPLGPIEAGVDYTLISLQAAPASMPAPQVSGLSFGRGARVTLATGAQKPVEALCLGERVLTRDHGMQPIRWMNTRTVQAVGAFAPVIISAGTLGNGEDLILSQTHRLLLSNWRAEVMVGSRDVLIPAGELINNETVFLRPGGFLEFTQLVFDAHEVIYVEGVPVESLAPTQQIVSGLRDEDAAELLRLFPDLPVSDPKLSRVAVDGEVAAKLLRETGLIAQQ